MRLLIGAAPSKLFHLEELSKALSKVGIECKIVNDVDFADGYPSRNYKKWINFDGKFEKLISEFKPDVIFVDRPRHFGLKSVNSKIPTVFLLRGDFWSEIEWAKETTYKSFFKKRVIKKWEEIGNECFAKASMILPICKYLENIVNEKYSKTPTYVLQQGIDSSHWYDVTPMKLNHPCVGILQSASIWGKTKELLLLRDILPTLPDVSFYWVGNGIYAEKILKEIEKFPNFKWLDSQKYPEKVREFLSGIDVYALISGIDMSPLSLQEAQLMKKAVLATDVGGIPELMKNDKTGYLISLGDSDEWIKKVKVLLENEKKRKEFGEEGRGFIEKNFNWDKLALDFSKILKEIAKENVTK